MILTDLQEILVILFGSIMLMISVLWAVIRIHNWKVRVRRRQIRRRITPPASKPDEEDKPPTDCQWG